MKDLSTTGGHVGRKKRLALAVGAWFLAGAFGVAPSAAAHPILDAKDAAVSISGTANMSIESSAANNLIKWVDFSIGKNEKVTFDAKNYLNYVTGSAVSDIQGTLKGTGNIYLVNPNGILIGDGATVNVGSLYLSTRSLTADQLANYSTATGALFKNDNAAVGDVINLGNLNANVISVEGNNITFKNVADVTKNTLDAAGEITGTTQNTAVSLTASGGEIHIGSAEGTASGYTVNGAAEIDYQLVSTAAELQAIQDGLAGNYMLAGDIDMSGFSGFTPIGLSGNGFTGRFDGLDYQIKNLAIDSDKGFVGLFGINTGVVENVGLTGGSVKGTANWATVGGVVGFNMTGGTVRNVYNTGSVTGTGTSATAKTGGIIGSNQGTVERAYNTGAVTGASDAGTGGIVGANDSGGKVMQVYNAGTVSAAGKQYVGGITGETLGSSISDAYNTGAVSGASLIGGIAGHQNYGTTITNVYNSGTVNGNTVMEICGNSSTYIGGIVGNAGDSSKVTNAYTSDLKNAATFTGFGFVNGVSSNGAWRIYEDKTMPLLTAFLTRKDNITSQTAYNGGADVGATYTATNFSGEVAQNGFNYIKDVSIVTPANVTFTVNDYTRAYNGTESTEGATLKMVGTIYGDDTVSGGTFTLDSKNAGTRTITVSNVTIDDGNGGKNYNVTYQNGTGTIEKANVTISVEDYSRAYDGTTDAAGAALKAVTGQIFAGDAVSGGTKTFDGKDAGTRTITVSDVTINDGNNGGNYNVTYTDGTGEITRKALSLVATPQTITEGEATPTAWSGSVTGFVTGEGLDGGDTLSFALDNPAAAAVGSYKVTGTLSIGGAAPLASGNYGDNYTFANAAANDTAFTIAAKSMTPQDIIDNPNAAQEYANTITFIERDTRDENQAAPPQEKLAPGTTATHTSHLTIENGGVNTPPNMDVAAALAAEASAEQTAATQESEEEEA